MHNTHWLHRNECLFSSMQIPWSLDPIWIGVGAVQHRRGCSTRLAWLPSAIQKKKEEKKKKRISSLEKLQVKNESDKNRNKERIAFWCSLYSAGFRGGNKTNAAADITYISYWCGNGDFYQSPSALTTVARSVHAVSNAIGLLPTAFEKTSVKITQFKNLQTVYLIYFISCCILSNIICTLFKNTIKKDCNIK